MNTILNELSEYWQTVGPAGRCAVLFLFGCLLIVGYLFNWKWLDPSHKVSRNYFPGIRRTLILVAGILCIICSIVFYIFKDELHWS